MGKKDKDKKADEAPKEEKGGDKKDDAKKDEKKDGKKEDSPEGVEQGAEEKLFDGFLSGKKPNGKSRGCTDCLCLLMIVSLDGIARPTSCPMPPACSAQPPVPRAT